MRSAVSLEMSCEKHSVKGFKFKGRKVRGNYHLGLHESWVDTQASQQFRFF